MKRPAVKASVGVRELRDRVSAVLRRVRNGETVAVTDRNRPIALLVPLGPATSEETLREIVKTGRIAWSGGKPRGARRPPKVRGPAVSDAVVEDRR
jgi:prevent-host-death family protein